MVMGQTVVKVFLRENPWDEPVDAHSGLRVQVVSNGGLPPGCRVFRTQTKNRVQARQFDLFVDAKFSLIFRDCLHVAFIARFFGCIFHCVFGFYRIK